MSCSVDEMVMEDRLSVRIGSRVVGEGHGVFIIAEAGVNHGGRVGAARRLIDAAREAGADAVKFQAFSADRLVSRDAPLCGYQRANSAGAAGQYEMLRALELRREDF